MVVSFSPETKGSTAAACVSIVLSLMDITSILPVGQCPHVLSFALQCQPHLRFSINNSVAIGWEQFVIIYGHCLMRNVKKVMCLLSKFHSWMIRRMDSSRNSHSPATVVDCFCSFVSSPDYLPQDNKYWWRRLNS